MTLSDLFNDATIRSRLAVFTDAEKDAIEQALFDKNGKPYIKCLVRGKEVQAKKEEVVRQLWLHRNPEFIAGVRKKLALDQREAAEIFGGGVNAFSRDDNGKTNPPLVLVKLLNVLDRHPDLLDEVRAS